MRICLVIIMIVLAVAWWSAQKEKNTIQEPIEFTPRLNPRGRGGRESQPEFPRGEIPRGRGRLYSEPAR